MPGHLEYVARRRRCERIEAGVRYPSVVGVGRIDCDGTDEAPGRRRVCRIDALEGHARGVRSVYIMTYEHAPNIGRCPKRPGVGGRALCGHDDSAAAIGAEARYCVGQRRTERGPVAAV